MHEFALHICQLSDLRFENQNARLRTLCSGVIRLHSKQSNQNKAQKMSFSFLTAIILSFKLQEKERTTLLFSFCGGLCAVYHIRKIFFYSFDFKCIKQIQCLNTSTIYLTIKYTNKNVKILQPRNWHNKQRSLPTFI